MTNESVYSDIRRVLSSVRRQSNLFQPRPLGRFSIVISSSPVSSVWWISVGFSKDFFTANAANPPFDSDDQPVINHAGTLNFSVQFRYLGIREALRTSCSISSRQPSIRPLCLIDSPYGRNRPIQESTPVPNRCLTSQASTMVLNPP
jgi:hypothetical protein